MNTGKYIAKSQGENPVRGGRLTLLELFPLKLVNIMLDFLQHDDFVWSKKGLQYEVEYRSRISEYLNQGDKSIEVCLSYDRDGFPCSSKLQTVEKAIPYRTLLDLAEIEGHSNVMVAPVLEPLKVRLISKGAAAPYAASMPFQKSMHGHLKKTRQCALIGTPLVEEHLTWLSTHWMTQLIESDPDHKSEWNSGDYSAATDNLNLNVTKAIFETVLSRVPEVDPSGEVDHLRQSMKDVARNVLYEQVINYPKLKTRQSPESFDQTCGQLMGSTLSFPVLCVANLVAYWLALEDYLKDFKQRYPDLCARRKPICFHQLPVLVNGDDILFRTNARFHELWLVRIEQLGFSLSPGKSLRHPRLLTINSMQYYMTGTTAQPMWTYTPYFNVGLLLNGASGKVARVGQSSAEDGFPDLASVWSDLQEGCFSQITAFAAYIRYHKETLSKQTMNGLLNLFATPLAGGLGFKVPVETDGRSWEFKWTRFQRLLAKQRFVRHIGQVVKKPVVSRNRLITNFPNYSQQESDGHYIVCRKGSFFPVGSRFVPLPTVPGVTNTGGRFADCFENGFKPAFEWISPSRNEVRSCYRGKCEWNNDSLATDEEMRDPNYEFVPVRFLPVALRIDLPSHNQFNA